jgi:hypothetical protein
MSEQALLIKKKAQTVNSRGTFTQKGLGAGVQSRSGGNDVIKKNRRLWRGFCAENAPFKITAAFFPV